jgi:hypothetical protein
MKQKPKIPNPKFQAPGKIQGPNPKWTLRCSFGAWDLVLLWSLEFGFWNFEG